MELKEELIDRMIEEYEDRIMILQGCIITLKAEKLKLKTGKLKLKTGKLKLKTGENNGDYMV